MKFSFHWIQELSGTVRTAQEVAELLNARSFEVKDIVEGPRDTVLDIDILPNRPDALSHLNVAREVCALEGRVFAPPQIEYTPASHASLSVTIENADACLRYGTLSVRGVTVGPSPDWIVQRLEACGLASINNVVDATNYTMLLLGQPMHAFDMASLDALVVRNARAGETLTALDEANTVYQLEPSMLVVADSKKPVCGAARYTRTPVCGAAHTCSQWRPTSSNVALHRQQPWRCRYKAPYIFHPLPPRRGQAWPPATNTQNPSRSLPSVVGPQRVA
jgi:phenylalanyl-tRNA synthetase beta chain